MRKILGVLVTLSNADRARRYRRHKKDDHSLCGAHCKTEKAASRVTRAVTQRGDRSRRLWREEKGDELTGSRRTLLEEACRITDRLDRLDAILSGDAGEWMRFTVSDDGAEVTVTLDKALAESRQQAVALKQLLTELRQSAGVAKPETGGSALDQLAAKRAARLANASG